MSLEYFSSTDGRNAGNVGNSGNARNGRNPGMFEMLEKSELKFIKTKSGRLDFRVFHPSKEELFAATPLPWASGRSWLRGIESGISGLGRYLNVENEASRAGKGIQAKNKLRSSRFKPTKYISKILNDFIQKIEKLSL